MSQIAATHSHGNGEGHGHGHGAGPSLAAENIYAPEFGKMLSIILLGLGVFGVLGCVGFGMMATDKGEIAKSVFIRNAAASYHVGAIIALGFSLGALGVLLILHQVAAGWTSTLRRQLENIVSMLPVGVGMVLVSVILGPWTGLWKWMNPGEDLGPKALYLNYKFFLVRVVIYCLVWIFLAARLNMLSRQQDVTGDKWLSNKAKFTSAYGLLAFALSVAFGSFDLIMTIDHHWFSTMFPVYFWAGNMVASLSLTAVLLSLLKGHGKLQGVVTSEHLHDVGKLMLGFTIFWAYIGFSQYFLIWYAGIPEETAWYGVRISYGWDTVGKILMFGHFLAPFLILLFKAVKRTPILIATVGLWIIAMHCLDVFWMIRPDIYNSYHEMHLGWVDLAGVLGGPCLMLGLLLMKVRAGVLIPIKDPRLQEGLEHKNYV